MLVWKQSLRKIVFQVRQPTHKMFTGMVPSWWSFLKIIFQLTIVIKLLYRENAGKDALDHVWTEQQYLCMNETPSGKEFQSMWWKLFVGDSDSVLSCAENSNQLHSPPHATSNIPAHRELN